MADGNNCHLWLALLFLFIMSDIYSCVFFKILIVFYIFGLSLSKLLLLWIVAKQTVRNWGLSVLDGKDGIVQQSTKFLPAPYCPRLTLKCRIFSLTCLNSRHVTTYWLIFVNGLWLSFKFYAKNQYEAHSKKDRTLAIKILLLILQHFKYCPLQSSLLYWRYTVPSIFSIVGMLLGMHWRAVLLSHSPESPLWFGNNILSKWC